MLLLVGGAGRRGGGCAEPWDFSFSRVRTFITFTFHIISCVNLFIRVTAKLALFFPACCGIAVGVELRCYDV
jgi:hypothetical protein